ncbi:NTF2-like N-terminal transpeptidase domain-containing protein [Arthrobacter sp. A5]|uniref:NTF2-like N-terminal transpeptidase domain-containing protein n=1 Tax=Arthrobacter sp. A5 TaxID=576926 RepID=UPI003DA9BA0A
MHFRNADGAAVTEKLGATTRAALPVKPEVSVDNVQVADGKATAALKVRWKFEGGDWNYSTSAELNKNDGGWMVAWRPDLLLPGFQNRDALKVASVAAHPADVLGDGGDVLVTERPVIRVGIDKSHIEVSAHSDSAKALAVPLDADPETYAQQVTIAGSAAFVEALVLRDDTARTVTDARIEAIPRTSAIKTPWSSSQAARLPVLCWAPLAMPQLS